VIKPLAQMLDAHRLRCGNAQTGPVFAASNGKPISLNNVLGRVIMPALQKANLDNLWHGWHAARRGLGSNLYSLGVSDKTIERYTQTRKREHNHHVSRKISTSGCSCCHGSP
jgi:hypothetical protein